MSRYRRWATPGSTPAIVFWAVWIGVDLYLQAWWACGLSTGLLAFNLLARTMQKTADLKDKQIGAQQQHIELLEKANRRLATEINRKPWSNN